MRKRFETSTRPSLPKARPLSKLRFQILPEIERRISNSRGQYPWLVFEGGGKVLGYAYASSHRQRKAYQWCVDVSVYICDEARNCGVGKALYSALFEMLRRQGYVNAYAGITLPNPASVRLHESLGFVPVGTYSRVGFKLGRWHDVSWFHLRLQEAVRPISEPLRSAPSCSMTNASTRYLEPVRKPSVSNRSFGVATRAAVSFGLAPDSSASLPVF